MKNLFILSMMLALGFVACDNKKVAEVEAKFKAYRDSVEMVNFNDSVAAAELALHLADSLRMQVIADSIANTATPAKKKTATKVSVDKIQDRTSTPKQVTRAPALE